MRITKADLIRERDAASERATVLSLALNSLVDGEVDATERARGDAPGLSYTFRLMRRQGAHGGIVLVTFRAPNQRPHSAAYYFESFDRARRDSVRYGGAGWSSEMHAAMDRLRVVRDAA